VEPLSGTHKTLRGVLTKERDCMCTYISDRVAKPRKFHRCRVCYEGIAVGEACHVYRGVARGEGFYTIYFHLECWEYSRDWEEQDWETCPGGISRNEVREALAETSRRKEREACS